MVCSMEKFPPTKLYKKNLGGEDGWRGGWMEGGWEGGWDEEGREELYILNGTATAAELTRSNNHTTTTARVNPTMLTSW